LHLLRGRRLAERGPSAIGAVAEPDADNYDGLRAGEATVLELTESIGTTQQNVSKHLGVLQRCGIVARRKQGNFAYYRIVDEGVLELCEEVCGSLQLRVESLRKHVGAALPPDRRPLNLTAAV
jgi:ArsR family transcriptional regulator